MNQIGLESVELYTSVTFGIVLLLLCLYVYWQIRSHGLGGSSSNGWDVPADWHAAPFGFSSFRGHAFRRLTDSSGYLLVVHSKFGSQGLCPNSVCGCLSRGRRKEATLVARLPFQANVPPGSGPQTVNRWEKADRAGPPLWLGYENDLNGPQRVRPFAEMLEVLQE